MEAIESHVIASQSSITIEQFWTAVNIWHKNPHFACRRLCGSVSVFCGIVSHLDEPVNHQKLINKVNSAEISASSEDNIGDRLRYQGIEIEDCDSGETEAADIIMSIKKLIPRNSCKYQYGLELVILDKKSDQALFTPLNSYTGENTLPYVSIPHPYSLTLVNGEMQLRGDNVQPANWLGNVLFPKLVKWAQLAEPVSSAVPSLSLVSVDSYIALYEKLKDKYGREMVRIWPENTDPAKFVYEDVAIATYLLLLWEKEREEMEMPDWKQSFIDLGCGNGLLVYILSSEGHRGVGLDVRKRGIWDIYPESTKLEVRSINPADNSCVFSDFDWLIGNHSDELTPWIPVLANRSSYSCNFFLLPCCFFDFPGNKYQRKDTSRSQYIDYLDFVQEICDTCGFHTQVDRLRIPSTKRTCLVGKGRTYLSADTTQVQILINAMINARSEGQLAFKPRVSEERVRNCTQLKKGVVEDVIQLVVKQLLNNCSPTLTMPTDRKWNAGVKMTLKELAEAIPKTILFELKNECGGLQTLLRNNRHVFVVAQGLVYLRDPSVGVVTKNRPFKKQKKEAMNKRRCWFYDNHPDGCPVSTEQCTFEH